MNKKDRKTKTKDRSEVMRELDDLDMRYLNSTTDPDNLDPTYFSEEVNLVAQENSPSTTVSQSAPAIPSDLEHYEYIGQNESGWMAIDVADDCLSADITHIFLGSDDLLSVNDLIHCIRDKFLITHGIDQAIITQVYEKARSMPGATIEERFTVARGIGPGAGVDGSIKYPVLENSRKRFVMDMEEVPRALNHKSLDAIKASNITGLLVFPGQVLAKAIEPGPGDAGVDVYGNTLVEVGESVCLSHGENVVENDNALSSHIYGYLCLSEERVSVVSPLWVDDDAMSAYFVLIPLYEDAPKLTEEWLLRDLKRLGIRHGIIGDAVRKISSHPMPSVDRPQTFRVASGDLPKNGRDASIDYKFDPLKRAGQITEDGGIDLRARNSHVSVTVGQTLLELSLPTDGKVGRNLYGEAIPASDGTSIELKPGLNVECQGENPIVYRAKIDGSVSLTEDTINVNDVIQVQGAIDYDTGNIESPSDVEISGDIVGGFSVISGGNVTIGGVIEAGATVVAGGDIIVANGISGKDTSVTARGLISMGTIHSKFIQNATVIARGNITVGLYIHNSDVRSGGSIKLQGRNKMKSGAIVGGRAVARDRIECSSVGSAMTRGTIIGLRPAPDEIAKCGKLRSSINDCEAKIRRLRQVVLAFEGATEKTAVTEKTRKKLRILEELQSKLLGEYTYISDEGAERLRAGRIIIRGTLFSGVEVIIGELHRQTTDDLIAVRIKQQDERIFFSRPQSK